jgi:hypothetical protein
MIQCFREPLVRALYQRESIDVGNEQDSILAYLMHGLDEMAWKRTLRTLHLPLTFLIKLWS